VPEAAVHEESDMPSRKHKVWGAWQVPGMQPKPQPQRMGDPPHSELWCRVARLNSASTPGLRFFLPQPRQQFHLRHVLAGTEHAAVASDFFSRQRVDYGSPAANSRSPCQDPVGFCGPSASVPTAGVRGSASFGDQKISERSRLQ
jgi:hypothetical protein